MFVLSEFVPVEVPPLFPEEFPELLFPPKLELLPLDELFVFPLDGLLELLLLFELLELDEPLVVVFCFGFVVTTVFFCPVTGSV